MRSTDEHRDGQPAAISAVRWSIDILRVESGRQIYAHQADRALRTASIGKLLLLIHIARASAAGQSRLDLVLSRTEVDTVADSGVWQRLSIDSLTVADLCELVGSVSDNLATNVLLRHFGLAAVAETTAALGLTSTALHDRVRDLRMPADPNTLSTGSAAELVHLMARLHRGEVFGERVSRTVLGWLANGMDLSQVGAGWLLDPLAHQATDNGLLLHHKTGTDSDVRADVGVLSGSGGSIAYAVIANWTGQDIAARRHVLSVQADLGGQIANAAKGSQFEISPAIGIGSVT